MEYILTDGKNYVIQNPLRPGKYMASTSPVDAMHFTYKQAKSLLTNKKSSTRWINAYHMVECETGTTCKLNKNYKGNGGCYIGDKKVEFDESVLDEIINEADSMLGLAGWDLNQLESFRVMLEGALSYYDSAISDIVHAMEKINPPAHTRTKIWGMQRELRIKHTRVKQCMQYIDVMKDAITYKYDIGKIKLELNKAKYSDYKGRTEYYEMILGMDS